MTPVDYLFEYYRLGMVLLAIVAIFAIVVGGMEGGRDD